MGEDKRKEEEIKWLEKAAELKSLQMSFLIIT